MKATHNFTKTKQPLAYMAIKFTITWETLCKAIADIVSVKGMDYVNKTSVLRAIREKLDEYGTNYYDWWSEKTYSEVGYKDFEDKGRELFPTFWTD